MTVRNEHVVTAGDLRRLATLDEASLFRDADTLIDCGEGVIRVPLKVVEETLSGRTKFTSCRLLYSRGQFGDDGVVVGKKPRTSNGCDLDARLADLAAGINDCIAPGPGGS